MSGAGYKPDFTDAMRSGECDGDENEYEDGDLMYRGKCPDGNRCLEGCHNDEPCRWAELGRRSLPKPEAGADALTKAATAALAACTRVIDQDGGILGGIDFYALGQSLRSALAATPSVPAVAPTQDQTVDLAKRSESFPDAAAVAPALPVPAIVREALLFYSGPLTHWITFNRATRESDLAYHRKSLDWDEDGEDSRGHEIFRATSNKADEALRALDEWIEGAAPSTDKGHT